WLGSADPIAMIRFSWRASRRKLRLVSVICCRRFWHLLRYKASRTAVEMSERWAEAPVTWQRLSRARDSAAKATRAAARVHGRQYYLAALAAQRSAFEFNIHAGAWMAAQVAIELADDPIEETKELCTIVRDIIGNPFRPLPPRPESIPAWGRGRTCGASV